MSMSVVLLTNESLEAKALANRLELAGVPLTHFVVFRPSIPSTPPIPPKERELRQRARSLEMPYIERNRVERDRQWSEIGIEPQVPGGVKIWERSDPNAKDLREELASLNPELFVVFGTPILKPDLFEIAPLGALNAHCSVLPHYRGTHSEFWQCYHQDFSYVGITIHLIDQGVDTGPICFQQTAHTTPPCDPHSLRRRNIDLILQNYPVVVLDALNGSLKPGPQDPRIGRTFRAKQATPDKKIALYERLLAQEETGCR